jgi:SagB-type dehydrogenase family enzyme
MAAEPYQAGASMRWHASFPSLLRAALAAAPLLALAALAAAQEPSQSVRLPEARREGAMSLEAALWARRSIRDLKPDALTLADAAQLLWAAQGKNRPDGHRTAPSAMAVYPLEVYLVAGSVEGLPPGVYRYRSATHDLVLAQAGDRRAELTAAPGRPPGWAASAPLLVVFAGAWDRASRRFGLRTERYTAMEVGLAAQNVYLQAAALGLGTTFMGSYNDSAMTRVLAADERPMGVMPVGKPR